MRASVKIMLENFPAKRSVVVETGTYLGDNAAFMVCNLTDAKKDFEFYTIDNFQYENIPDGQKSIDQAYHGYKNYKDNIESLGVDWYIKTILSDSIKAISLFKDSSVYFLYVDDNHFYDHVKKELSLWVPKIIKGGIIFGDDYECPDVGNAFRETFGTENVVAAEGGCYVRL